MVRIAIPLLLSALWIYRAIERLVVDDFQVGILVILASCMKDLSIKLWLSCKGEKKGQSSN